MNHSEEMTMNMNVSSWRGHGSNNHDHPLLLRLMKSKNKYAVPGVSDEITASEPSFPRKPTMGKCHMTETPNPTLCEMKLTPPPRKTIDRRLLTDGQFPLQLPLGDCMDAPSPNKNDAMMKRFAIPMESKKRKSSTSSVSVLPLKPQFTYSVAPPPLTPQTRGTSSFPAKKALRTPNAPYVSSGKYERKGHARYASANAVLSKSATSTAKSTVNLVDKARRRNSCIAKCA